MPSQPVPDPEIAAPSASGRDFGRRRELAADLRRSGYLVGDPRVAERGAGLRAYFEKDLPLSRPGILARCASLLAAEVPPECDRLAASGPAALALATALAMTVGAPLVFIDADRELGGDVFPGATVTLVADVVLTGATAERDAADLQRHGLEPVRVLALLDRDRGARARLEGAGLPLRTAFVEGDLLPAAAARG